MSISIDMTGLAFYQHGNFIHSPFAFSTSIDFVTLGARTVVVNQKIGPTITYLSPLFTHSNAAVRFLFTGLPLVRKIRLFRQPWSSSSSHQKVGKCWGCKFFLVFFEISAVFGHGRECLWASIGKNRHQVFGKTNWQWSVVCVCVIGTKGGERWGGCVGHESCSFHPSSHNFPSSRLGRVFTFNR